MRRLFLEKGDTLEFQAVIHDITHRKQAEESLLQGTEVSLIDHIPDAVWTANASGELLFVSDNVEEILGYEPEELTQISRVLWLKRIHPEDRAMVQGAFGALFAEENSGYPIPGATEGRLMDLAA